MKNTPEDSFKPRLGRIRSGGGYRRAKTYLSRIKGSIQRAGPRSRGGRRTSAPRGFSGARRVIVKARVVRMSASSKVALGKHLDYIRRESATRETDQGKVFGAYSDDVDRDVFLGKAGDDRHHFRFIVSPDDADQMKDLKPFVRDLVNDMSRDLGTDLDWVAAVHHNTAHPHAHIVVRGRRNDGRDLVIPRKYISHGIRERASELLTIELGPETRLEQDKKLARETHAERLTRTDRSLIRAADDNGRLDLNRTSRQYRTLNTARLRVLERMKLAEQTGPSSWQLNTNLAPRLKELGERGDIIKSLNKALAQKRGRQLDVDFGLKSDTPRDRNITGSVLKAGLDGDFHDQKFVVVDTLDGRVVKARLHNDTRLQDLTPGSVVRLSAPSTDLKPSDRTIAEIASKHGGTYSPALHQEADPRATPAFITAHVRRLEALRRTAKIGTRNKDGSWSLPENYLQRARHHQLRQASNSPLRAEVLSSLPLNQQALTTGLTWLDKTEPDTNWIKGYGAEVITSKEHRQRLLVERGVLKTNTQKLQRHQMETLRRTGLEENAKAISDQTGKSYRPAPHDGPVNGVFSHTLQTGDGPYAVLQTDRSFTLVKWRGVMERSRGLQISGIAKGGKVSWKLGSKRVRGLSR